MNRLSAIWVPCARLCMLANWWALLGGTTQPGWQISRHPWRLAKGQAKQRKRKERKDMGILKVCMVFATFITPAGHEQSGMFQFNVPEGAECPDPAVNHYTFLQRLPCGTRLVVERKEDGTWSQAVALPCRVPDNIA